MFYRGGSQVGPGSYWDLKQGERIKAAADVILPGVHNRFYIKASTATMVVAAPLAGLAFVVLFPFIGTALAIGLFVRRVLAGIGRSLVKSRSFGWKPIEAYFSGKKRMDEAPRTYANVDEILEALNGRKSTGHTRNSRDRK